MSLAAINKHFQEEEKKRKQIPMGMSSTSSSSMLIILKSEKKKQKKAIFVWFLKLVINSNKFMATDDVDDYGITNKKINDFFPFKLLKMNEFFV